MKKIIMCTVICLVNVAIWACPVCERQQPKILKGVVHGAGPQNMWDYVSVWGMGIITLFTLFYSIKWLINPKESNQNHIKYSILNEK